MKILFKPFIFLLLLVVLACGKKTAPIPKSQFISPDESMISIAITENGCNITNNSNTYNLIVSKSTCETCANNFQQLVVIPPEHDYTDRDVVENEPIIYKFTFKHPEYNIFSQDIIKRVTYNKPVSVVNLEVTVKNNFSLLLEPQFSDKIHHYEVYLNNHLLYKTRDKELIISLIEDSNTITIVPFDIYNNEGTHFVKTIKKDELLKPEDIKKIDYVFGRKNLFISWEESKNANYYEVTLQYNNTTKTLKTSVNYLRIDIPDNVRCVNIDILSGNEFQKSSNKQLKACR